MNTNLQSAILRDSNHWWRENKGISSIDYDNDGDEDDMMKVVVVILMTMTVIDDDDNDDDDGICVFYICVYLYMLIHHNTL